METRQLVLISDEPSRDWRLDDHTRQVGRAGIAAAREALRAANSHLLTSASPARNHADRLDHDERHGDHFHAA